jgi:hypothetical protein
VVALVVVLCPLPFLVLREDPYDRVHLGMTTTEVEGLLGPARQDWVFSESGRDAFLVETRSRFWDVIVVNYEMWGHAVRIKKRRRSAAELWEELREKIGLAPGPSPPAAVVPVTPPSGPPPPGSTAP